jgi:hypothetical protein
MQFQPKRLDKTYFRRRKSLCIWRERDRGVADERIAENKIDLSLPPLTAMFRCERDSEEKNSEERREIR